MKKSSYRFENKTIWALECTIPIFIPQYINTSDNCFLYSTSIHVVVMLYSKIRYKTCCVMWTSFLFWRKKTEQFRVQMCAVKDKKYFSLKVPRQYWTYTHFSCWSVCCKQLFLLNGVLSSVNFQAKLTNWDYNPPAGNICKYNICKYYGLLEKV